MADGIGLAVGAANLRAVRVGRAAVARSAVLTQYAGRPPEVGVPGENPNLTERGLIITDFVDRVGDPVPIVASDGSSHRADAVAADALRALLHTLVGASTAEPIGVAHPTFWRPTAVDALRGAVTALPDFRGPIPAVLVPDATAAAIALQQEPGLPSRGVIAVCDFGATGTSITLVDAGQGFAPVAPAVRFVDLSGDVIDQAVLSRVVADLTAAGSIDVAGTSALGSLTRLRARCRGVKERLSTTPVTALTIESPGSHAEVRITRNELDEAIRAPLDAFLAELRDVLRRNDIRQSDLAAVASVGGGARIPVVTTALSEHLRVPVITAAQPELAAAIGAGLRAVRGTVVEAATSVAPAAAAPPTMAAASVPDAAPRSSAFQALAWSAADDAPEVVEAADCRDDYPADAARPRLAFDPADERVATAGETPWYRRTPVLAAAGLVAAFVALAAVVLFAFRSEPSPDPASNPGSTATTTAPAGAPPTAETTPTTAPPATAPAEAPPAPRTVTREAPPPAVTVTQTASAAPPPTSEAPPPTSEAPPVTTQAPPPSSTLAPSTTAPSTRNPFNLPYSTLPGLPFVPAPPGVP